MPMRLHAVALLVVCAMEGLAPPVLRSQELGTGPVMGISFERFGAPLEGPVAFAFRRSRLTHGGPAEDLTARIFPQGLAEGVAIIGGDAGLMQSLRVGPAAVYIKGGATVLTALGPGGFEVLPGLGVGGGLLLRLQRRAALRADVTRHTFFRGAERYGVWSFALGLAVLPPAGSNRPQ